MKPSLPTLHFQFAAAFAVLLLASQTLRAEINPDPGSGEVTSLSVTRTVPGSTVYDPAVPLAGGETYAMTPDRYGQINLTLDITHNFQGTITTSIRDADGFTITQATGNSPTLSFSPRKFRYPFVITVTSPTNVPAFTRLIVPDGHGNTLGSGFVGHHGDHGTDWDRDELTLLPQYDDSGGYDLEGRSVSSGACGPCQSSSCDLSHGNETANADTSGPQGRFLAGFSAGTSMQGDSFSGVDVEINPTAGVSRASFKAYGTGDAVITRVNQILATITTQSAHTKFENISNGVRVSISKTANDAAFRVITFVNTARNEVTRTSTFLGKSDITVWKYSASPRTWTITMGNGARVSKLILTEDGTSQRVQTRQLYERSANETGIANILVSEVHETYQKNLLGWRKTRSEIACVTNGNLITKWQYYAVADGNTRSGLLKSVQRPDGSYENHDYFIDSNSKTHHTISRPFAGEGTLTESRFRLSNGSRIDFKESVSDGVLSGILSESYQNWSSSIQMSHHQHDGSGYLVTTYSIKAFGTDFGGVPTRIEHPDGTRTTQTIIRQPNNSYRNLTIERGSRVGTGVGEGVTITTARDQNGVLHTKTVTAKGGAGNGITLESIAAAYPDIIGRPTQINYFIGSPNSWTIHREYACCGLVSETDKFGITTFHAYDDLKRRIKSNRLGVTTETHYLGLTTETHRYPETVQSTLSPALSDYTTTLIAKTVRNLANTETSTYSPDPTSDQPGTLIPASTTTVNYLPNFNPQTQDPGQISRTVTTTVPGDHSQTEEYFLDGRLYRTYGDLSPAMEYTYTANATGAQTSQSYVEDDTLRETTTTQYDLLGRIKTVTKGSIIHQYVYYNSADPLGSRGQLKSITDSDQVTTLYAYNAKGERTITAIDLNANGVINYGTDQITRTVTFPIMRNEAPTIPVVRTLTHVWLDATTQSPNGVETLVSRTDRTPDGLQSWSWQIGRGTTHTLTDLTTPATPQSWTVTTTHPDNTKTIQIHTSGRLATVNTVNTLNSVNQLLHSTTYGYEEAVNGNGNEPGIPGRLRTRTDSRTGTTTTAYLSTTADIVKSITEPGTPPRVTSFTYDPRGRRTHVDAPDTLDAQNNTLANITETIYNPDGTVHEVKGDQTYRVEYGYDYALRHHTMKTFGAEEATTTWFYNHGTGLLDRKEYQVGDGTDYGYTPAGRLQSRQWARGRITSYSYTQGRLTGVSYFGTAALWQAYLDKRSEWLALLDAPNATQQEIDDAEAAMIAARAANAAADDSTTPNLIYTYDALGRIRTVTRGGVPHAEYTYRASDLQRLAEIQQIDTLNQAVTYTYEDGTNGTVAGRPGGFTSAHASAVWAYDNAGRLATVANGTDTFTYGYRYTLNAGLHEGITTPDQGTESPIPFTLVGPQVDTVLAYETTRNALVFRQNDTTAGTLSKFTYTVNAIGQRDSLTPTGDAFANNTPFAWGYNHRGELTAATRNSLTAFERAYSYDGIGNRLTATDHNAAATNYFGDAAGNDAGGNALNQYGRINYPGSTTLQPVHDADGNMTSGPVPGANGLNPGVPVPANATLTWDGENRLVKAVVNGTTVNYAYDHQSRLISRSEGVSPTSVTRYLYDGWNRIAEYESNGSGHTLKRSYLWGMDLSGSMQGAGGVGGLLSMTVHETTAATYYPTYDGNGNISEYINDSGAKVAHFEYDPFGNLTVDSENKAAEFPYRFSTKHQDSTTGLYYYGYRYYDPVTGRWPSRDPIEEEGGINLYGFVGNDGANGIDVLGLIVGIGRNVNCDNVDQFLLDALLAKAAYSDNATRDRLLPEGWRHTAIAQDNNTGLSSSIFEGPNGEVVVSFRGTQLSEMNDWQTNISQGAGLYGDQYRQVQQLSQDGSAPNATRVVGHSLGGGLAAAYGSSRGLPTTTFNAAGVHMRTSLAFGNGNYNNINSVVMRGEVLNTSQDAIPLVVPMSRGRRSYLNPTGIQGPIELHGMDSVIKSLKALKECCNKNRKK